MRRRLRSTLRESMSGPQLSDKLRAVLSCVDGQSGGDDEEGLGEGTDCQLFS